MSSHSRNTPQASRRARSAAAQDERQERAEHVPTDGRVAVVEDGPGDEQRLGLTEQLFPHPQLLVLQCHLGSGEVSVGA
jgi:hypothetical protein